MWRKIVLAQVVAWSLVAGGVARAEDQGSIIDPNGGSSRTVKPTRGEPVPPAGSAGDAETATPTPEGGGVVDPNG